MRERELGKGRRTKKPASPIREKRRRTKRRRGRLRRDGPAGTGERRMVVCFT